MSTTETTTATQTQWHDWTIEGLDADGAHEVVRYQIVQTDDADYPWQIIISVNGAEEEVSDYDDLAEALKDAREWSQGRREDHQDNLRARRAALAEGLETLAADEAPAGSDEAQVLVELAALIARGQAGDVLKALGAAGLR